MDAAQGTLQEPLHEDLVERDHILRCLFLTILRGYFIANNSSIVPFSLVGVVRKVDLIRDYD